MNELDYCDRCGAAGRVYVVMPSGNDLVFCGHHGREYGPQLVVCEAEISSDELTLQPA